MSKLPASRRKTVNASVGTDKVHIVIVAGRHPYLWIRNDNGGCHGVVKNKHVKKLRDMCNEILDRREIEGLFKK